MATNVPMMEATDLLGLSITPEGDTDIVPTQSFVTHTVTENLVLFISMDVTRVAYYIQSYKRNNVNGFIFPPSFERGFQGLVY